MGTVDERVTTKAERMISRADRDHRRHHTGLISMCPATECQVAWMAWLEANDGR